MAGDSFVGLLGFVERSPGTPVPRRESGGVASANVRSSRPDGCAAIRANGSFVCKTEFEPDKTEFPDVLLIVIVPDAGRKEEELGNVIRGLEGSLHVIREEVIQRKKRRGTKAKH